MSCSLCGGPGSGLRGPVHPIAGIGILVLGGVEYVLRGGLKLTPTSLLAYGIMASRCHGADHAVLLPAPFPLGAGRGGYPCDLDLPPRECSQIHIFWRFLKSLVVKVLPSSDPHRRG